EGGRVAPGRGYRRRRRARRQLGRPPGPSRVRAISGSAVRILHVNKYLYRRGGAESYMQELAALQRDAGHQVAFFGMDHPENDPQPYATHFPPYLELEPPPASAVAKARGLAR